MSLLRCVVYHIGGGKSTTSKNTEGDVKVEFFTMAQERYLAEHANFCLARRAVRSTRAEKRVKESAFVGMCESCEAFVEGSTTYLKK